MQSQFDYRLGFDGGGTNTRAVAVDAGHRVLGRGQSGASNPYAVGMNAALDNIERAADAALGEANLTRAQIGGWGLGLGGVCSAHESADVENALRARIGDARVGNGPRIVAVEDVVAAWVGAFGGEVAPVARAVCIAGTGANCWGKNARGHIAGADGSGPILGDRGSGYWIGERALRHAARAADGVVAADALAREVFAALQVADLKALIRLVYAPDFVRSRVADLVPVVLAHAEENAAQTILAQAGRELALTSLAVLRQLSDDENANAIAGEVALIGGVLAHAAPVQTAFLELLRQQAPAVRFVEARFDAAIGAALACD